MMELVSSSSTSTSFLCKFYIECEVVDLRSTRCMYNLPIKKCCNWFCIFIFIHYKFIMIQYYIKGLFSIILNIHCKHLTLKQYVIVQCDFFLNELYFENNYCVGYFSYI